MKSKTRYDLCVPLPNPNGAKPFWHKVGIALLGDDGRLSVKINSVPVGEVSDKNGNAAPWNGWLNAFEKTDDYRSGSRDSTEPSKNQRNADLDDDIPF